jgi:hypothetical protein
MNVILPPNYTQIPNVIFDYWMPKLKPTEGYVLLILCRKIFGWHKTSDTISANQLVKATGLSKPTVIASLKELEALGLILKIQSAGQFGCLPNEFKLNISIPLDNLYTDFTLESMKEKDDTIKITGGGGKGNLPGVVKDFNRGVVKDFNPQKKDSTKERLTKERIGGPPPKISFGKFVELKKGEYEEFCKNWGKDIADYYIQAVDDHVPNRKEGPYLDYAAAIRQFHRRDEAQGSLPRSPQKTPSASSSPLENDENFLKNKSLCEMVHTKIHHLFNRKERFSIFSNKAELISELKDIHMIYEFSKFDPSKLKEILLRDLEACFPGARATLLGRPGTPSIEDLMSKLTEKFKNELEV